MTHLIVHRCSDRILDADGYDRTAELSELMEHRTTGYYVLLARAGPTESSVRDWVVAGPFVRLCNAHAAAAEIGHSLAASERASVPGEHQVS